MTPLRVAQSVAENAPAPAQLTQGEAENPASTSFGTVSGQRLGQSINANFNVSGGAPKYACRAWVNFTGSTGVIKNSGNVSSVTRNGTGNYFVNFATNMPDADYAVMACGFRGQTNADGVRGLTAPSTPEVSRVRIVSGQAAQTSAEDPNTAFVAIFR
jgi:hypothetical protein